MAMNDWWDNYSRTTRATLRRLAAHVRHAELESALAALDEGFRAWRAGRLPAEELQERVHAFHQGPARGWYIDAADHRPIAALLRGLGSGILKADDLPEEARRDFARGLSVLSREEGTGKAELGQIESVGRLAENVQVRP